MALITDVSFDRVVAAFTAVATSSTRSLEGLRETFSKIYVTQRDSGAPISAELKQCASRLIDHVIDVKTTFNRVILPMLNDASTIQFSDAKMVDIINSDFSYAELFSKSAAKIVDEAWGNPSATDHVRDDITFSGTLTQRVGLRDITTLLGSVRELRSAIKAWELACGGHIDLALLLGYCLSEVSLHMNTFSLSLLSGNMSAFTKAMQKDNIANDIVQNSGLLQLVGKLSPSSLSDTAMNMFSRLFFHG
jgi:hypothetical protein